MTNSLLWTPLVFGIAGLVVPKQLAGWWATLGAAVTVRGGLRPFEAHATQAQEVDTLSIASPSRATDRRRPSIVGAWWATISSSGLMTERR